MCFYLISLFVFVWFPRFFFFKFFLLILSIYCTAFSFHFDLIFVQFPIDRACVPVSECVQRSRQMFRRNVCFDFHSAVHEKWRCIGIVMTCCFTDFLWFFFDSSLYFSVCLSPRLSLSLSLSLYLSIYLSIYPSITVSFAIPFPTHRQLEWESRIPAAFVNVRRNKKKIK